MRKLWESKITNIFNLTKAQPLTFRHKPTLHMRVPIRLPLFLLMLSCHAPPSPTGRAFFYWKTVFALTPYEQAVLDSTRCERLYVKYLDIGRDDATGEIVPYALLRVQDTTGLKNRSIVPTIFITNETFKGIDNQQIEWLADRTIEAVASVNDQWPAPQRNYREVLIDCDWSGSTRATFFAYLKALRNKLNATTRLAATIRLHQYAAPKSTGVPPVERGLLMLYNTGNIEQSSTQNNSIFSTRDALPYLHQSDGDYPLPMDVALPVFSWGLVFRSGELWRIIPTADALHAGQVVDNQYIVIQKPQFVAGHLLAPNDTIRIERITPDLLREAKRVTDLHIRLAPDGYIGLYHLDEATLMQWQVDNFLEVWQ
jgi:hypothetical protein